MPDVLAREVCRYVSDAGLRDLSNVVQDEFKNIGRFAS